MKRVDGTSGEAAQTGARAGALPVTIWGELERLKEANSTERQDLYDLLIRRYWKPVYCYILREDYGVQKSEDLVMDFFALCFEKNVFAKADPARGRFRSFLLKSLEHFIANVHREARAKKRAPSQGFISIHDLATSEGWHVQLAETKTPEDAFHRAWTFDLLLRVQRRLEQEFRAKGQQAHYEIFVARILQPLLDGNKAAAYSDMARQYQLSKKEAKNRLITARRGFQRLLREEIRSYASSDDEVAQEIQDIFKFLSDL